MLERLCVSNASNDCKPDCVVNKLVSIQIFVQETILFYPCFDSENVAGSNYMMLVSNPNSLSKLYFFIFLFFYFSFNLSLLSVHMCAEDLFLILLVLGTG